MSEIHFRSHFCPFQIDRTFWMSEIHFRWHSGHFRSIRIFFLAILDGTTMSIIELILDIWMSNACVKFEERRLNPSKVIALTTKLWRGGGGRNGGCVANENIIFPETCVSREYNYTKAQIALKAPVCSTCSTVRETHRSVQRLITPYLFRL